MKKSYIRTLNHPIMRHAFVALSNYVGHDKARNSYLSLIFSYFPDIHISLILGSKDLVPIEQESAILPARVANHSSGFDSSCPLMELAI